MPGSSTLSTLVVTLYTAQLPEEIDLELPGDVPLGELLPALVQSLHLEDDAYCLLCGERRLPETRTLFDAHVLAGDRLTLLPQHECAAAAAEEETPPAATAGAGDQPGPSLADLVGAPPAPRSAQGGQVVALWSGPAGGTGRTTLSLLLAAWAAERGRKTALLALSEPALSVYLHLPRRPDVTTFFQTGDLDHAMQRVAWASPHGIDVLLGAARPHEGRTEPEQVTSLLEALRAAYALVLVDLPPLAAAPSSWLLEPLRSADALLQVVPPTARGVVAEVEMLVALHDLDVTAPLHLVLVRRGDGGLSRREMTDGVQGLWGECPPLVADVPFVPLLAAAVERGEMPTVFAGDAPRQTAEETSLSRELAAIAQAAWGS